MDIFLVGGAVRDRLLGLPVQERDWVVVGATPEDLLRQGYRPVGRDFPVFLHPETAEEYALARTERKTAPGHGGFVFHAREDVSLEEDLQRRDLTINAIAERPDGSLVDPCGGVADLDARVLRHVSGAFVEDPLRVLRVARFAARFSEQGFTVAPETLALMRRISESNELSTLSPERIWQELARALRTARPSVFLQVLNDVGALAPLLPTIHEALTAIVGDDAGGDVRRLPAIASLDAPVEPAAAVEERFVALAAGVSVRSGAGNRAVGPDDAAAARARELAERLRAPTACRDPAIAFARGRRALYLLPGTTAAVLLDAALAAEAGRAAGRFGTLARAVDRLLLAEGADGAHRGRVRRVLAALPDALAVDARSWAAAGLAGAEIGERVRAARTERISRLLAET